MENAILKQLQTESPFLQVFEDLEQGEDGFSNVPRRKTGHIRLGGASCDFWVRLITRERDYNLYLYAFAKEKDSCGS